MSEFWEAAFQDKEEMWGYEPAKSAVLAADFFMEQNAGEILIPGIGYGRNAQVFLERGMRVTGIEISQTALELAKKRFGEKLTIYLGSVTQMPYDGKFYDGIFCYGLIYLLNEDDRKKLIEDCFSQLVEGGYMIFTAVTKDAPIFGQGKFIGEDRFEMFGGVAIFFYDRETISMEFGRAGLVEVSEIEENYPFYLIICRKGGIICT